MDITFLNDNSKKDMRKRGEEHWESRSEDLRLYMNDPDVYEKGNEDLPPFHEYGLNFDYVEPETFDDQEEGYHRFQFSWGGPSEELRFYEDEDIEFVFLDWFCGIGFNVSEAEEAQWLFDVFKGMGMLQTQN